MGVPNGSEVPNNSEVPKEKPVDNVENTVDNSALPNLSKYKGDSLVDGLKSVGYDSSMKSRKKLWEKIRQKEQYKGTKKQNTLLLNFLKGKNVTVGIIPSLKGYKGFSLVDGLKQFGYNSSFASRGFLWSAIGKKSKYKGTSQQNTTLLNYLKSH